MIDNTTNTTTNNRPAYDAVIMTKGESDEDVTWTNIGAAWQSKDQSGLNLVLNELPFTPDGKQAIYLRKRKAAKPVEATAPDAQ